MNKQRLLLKFIGCLAVLATVIAVIWWRSSPTVSGADRIKAVLAKIVAGAVSGDAGAAMSSISREFTGPGGITYGSAYSLLLKFLFVSQYPGGVQVNLEEQSLRYPS